ncbi:MAG TPA: enoyl-CoA hydratase/isomerase family protein, partial [Paracoccaceae bacterium]|nr:enoyl-CoA hydratase/isomerase family protein [Paracoccaceae bacterium]
MDEVLFDRYGRLGLVTLNRPKAMNALTHGMVLAMEARLDAWADDPGIAVVAIRGAGDRAFAAGGDIRTLYDQGREDGRRNFAFFNDEYRLNTKIKRYPKPYVALMDGIVMGGGVGVSVHGTRRIAGDRTVFAMPETGIGLFPDVGGTFFLPRLPGETGMWLALTGARLKTADVVACGICDLHVASERTGDLIDALSRLDAGERTLDAVDEVLAACRAAPRGEAVRDTHAERIDRCFGAGSVEAILAALEADGSDWAGTQRAAILTKSPSSTRIAFRQLREGAGLEFEDCMALEYRLARWCMTHPDFY